MEWTTTAELNTFGFHVFRGGNGEFANAVRITEEMIFGQGANGGAYAVEDRLAQPGATYWYWLVETETQRRPAQPTDR